MLSSILTHSLWTTQGFHESTFQKDSQSSMKAGCCIEIGTTQQRISQEFLQSRNVSWIFLRLDIAQCQGSCLCNERHGLEPQHQRKKTRHLLNIFPVYKVMRNKEARGWYDHRFNKTNMINEKKTSLKPNQMQFKFPWDFYHSFLSSCCDKISWQRELEGRKIYKAHISTS